MVDGLIMYLYISLTHDEVFFVSVPSSSPCPT